MLCNTDQARAVEYLNDVFDQVPNFDELLQLSVIELIRKDCRNNSTNRVMIYLFMGVFKFSIIIIGFLSVYEVFEYHYILIGKIYKMYL